MGHLSGRCDDFADLAAGGELDDGAGAGAGKGVGVEAGVTGSTACEGGAYTMAG